MEKSSRLALFVLVALWTAAAIAKTASFDEFARSVDSLRVVPEFYVAPFARAVILGEAAIVAMLLASKLRAAGVLGTKALLAGFAGVQAWRWIAAIQVPCNCFGAIYKLTPLSSLVLIGLMFAAALALDGSSRNGAFAREFVTP